MSIFHRLLIRGAGPRRWFPALTCLKAAGLLFVLAGCQRLAAPPPQPPTTGVTEKEPPRVSVIKPERKTVRRTIKRPGYNIEAYQTAPMYAKIPGYIRKWNVDIGDPVRKGQVLAELWVPEMEVEVRQKAAAVNQADAEVGQAKAVVSHAQAEHDRMKTQSERMAGLQRNGGVVNAEVVDESRFGFEAARATLTKARADVKAAEARLEVAREAHNYAQTLLEYAKITAPFDGVVTHRHINDGDFVHPMTGSKGKPLFVVDQVDPVRVFVNAPEEEAVWVSPGAKASVRSPNLPGLERKGTVTRTARALDPVNRTLRTEIDLENADKTLLPGMYVDIIIVVEHLDVWTLPPSAVVSEEGQTFCYRVEGDKAVRTPLRLGLRGDGLVEVLKMGRRPASPSAEETWDDFTGKEEIVKGEAARLKDGQAVHPSAGDK
jgi:RND family efflux transporter MFP subunit